MKIICIGRNYAEHAAEMNASVPLAPMFFMKPDTALNKESEFYLPDFSKEIHYELEIVLKINKVGKNIHRDFSKNYFNELALGIDFTARDLQKKCKEKGHPWEIAKAFDNSAYISSQFVSVEELDLTNLQFQLIKNGEIVQDGNSKDMIFPFDQLIEHTSKFITLKQGDLLYTGTPKGVGAVKIGDILEGSLNGKTMFTLKIM